MLVRGFLIQNIGPPNRSYESAVLCQFEDENWISLDREDSGHKVGPVTVLDFDGLPPTKTRRFEPAPIHWSGKVLHFNDVWTLPNDILYVLVLPQGYDSDAVNVCGESLRKHEMHKGITSDGQLYYHIWIDGDLPKHEVRISATLRAGPSAHQVENDNEPATFVPSIDNAAFGGRSADQWIRFATAAAQLGNHGI